MMSASNHAGDPKNLKAIRMDGLFYTSCHSVMYINICALLQGNACKLLQIFVAGS